MAGSYQAISTSLKTVNLYLSNLKDIFKNDYEIKVTGMLKIYLYSRIPSTYALSEISNP